MANHQARTEECGFGLSGHDGEYATPRGHSSRAAGVFKGFISTTTMDVTEELLTQRLRETSVSCGSLGF